MTKKFWMVQAVPGGVAVVKHETKGDAVAEAIRLAGLANSLGKEFVVLEAISVHKVEKPPVVSKTLGK